MAEHLSTGTKVSLRHSGSGTKMLRHFGPKCNATVKLLFEVLLQSMVEMSPK